jgi:hypothetical protein
LRIDCPLRWCKKFFLLLAMNKFLAAWQISTDGQKDFDLWTCMNTKISMTAGEDDMVDDTG